MFDSHDTVGFEKDSEKICPELVVNEPIETDVEGLKADAYYHKGIDKFPVFDVDFDNFHANVKLDRRNTQYAGNAGEYIRRTENRIPVLVRYNGPDGAQLRKIK